MNKILILTTLLTIIMISCSKKQDLLVASIPEEYIIIYFNDSIQMKKIDKLKNITEISTLIKKDLGYYFVSECDTTLYLSILKDTIIYNRYFNHIYKTKIERINSSIFKSSNYFIDDRGDKNFLSSLYYDKNYKIVRYEKSNTVTFVPK